ncbi:MAG: hypothetical protein JRG74_11570 [Deltaproteobacteria bacterium]|nr:hypothetical protein [Deltaproteobacteria bacterium]
MKKRPIGLVVFAVINFVFAASCLIGLGIAVLVKDLMAQSGVSLNTYTLLSPVLTCMVLIVSGVGFIRMSYGLGFLGGLFFCFASLANILVFNALRGFEGFAGHIPSMIYPVVLLLFLTLRYRKHFGNDSKNTEQSPAGDVLRAAPEE